jgi:M6 family metalloprotease-like protein
VSTPPTLAEFGHGSLTIGGASATGPRKLFVVLVDYSENPPIADAHGVDYYHRLAFGDPAPPFSTTDPVNPASLAEYFRENSYGRFWFEREYPGVASLNMGPLGPDPGQVARCTAIIRKLAVLDSIAFIAADADHDSQVSREELAILLVENFPNAAPDISGHEEVESSLHIHVQLERFTITVKVSTVLAGGGPRTPFYQLAHELSHAALGTLDMYNTNAGNFGMTLMSGYSFTSDDQYTVHLDIWHKLALGWAEPRVFPLGEAGSTELWEGADGAILLWDETRRTDEFFLVERRRPDAPGQRFDSGFAGDGAVIWRVKKPVDGGVVTLGSPDLSAGTSGVWEAGSKTPTLIWADGTMAPAALSVAETNSGRLRVSWD